MSSKARRKKRLYSSSEHFIRDIRCLPDGELEKALKLQIEKEDFRKAIEISKEASRRRQAGRLAVLIARAYASRAERLIEQRLFLEAETVIRNGQQLGVESPAMRRALFRAQLAVRRLAPARSPYLKKIAADLAEAERALAPPAHTNIQNPPPNENGNAGARDPGPEDTGAARLPLSPEDGLLADFAVLSECQPGVMEEPLRAEAAAVKAAFAAYERGDGEAFQLALRGIGRRSACAPWRLLLRGLAALEDGNEAQALELWKPISPGTICGQVAAALAATLPANSKGPAAPTAGSGDERPAQLWNLNAASPAEKKFRRLQAAVAKEDSEQALPLAREMFRAHPAIFSAELRRRLGSVIISTLPLGPDELEEATEIFGTGPDDPEGYRAQAIAQEMADPLSAHTLWKVYLNCLPRNPAIKPSERNMALGMIWSRLGGLLEKLGGGSDGGPAGGRLCLCPTCRARREALQGRLSASACYQKAVQLEPDDLEAAQKCIEALFSEGRKKEAEKCMHRLIERRPDHVPALLRLGEILLARSAFGKAQKFFERARALEPLDSAIVERMEACCLSSVRRLLKAKKFSRARLHLQRAKLLDLPGPRIQLHLLLAAAEQLAGKLDQAGEIISRLTATGISEGTAAFRMLRELNSLEAPQQTLEFYEEAVKAVLSGNPNAPLIQEMADFFAGHVLGTRRRGLDPLYKFSGLLVDHVRRGLQLLLEEPQLLAACRFLHAMEEWEDLLKVARKASSSHRQNWKFLAYEMAAECLAMRNISSDLPHRLKEAMTESLGGSAEKDRFKAYHELLQILGPASRKLAARLPFLAGRGRKRFAGAAIFDGEDEEEEEEE